MDRALPVRWNLERRLAAAAFAIAATCVPGSAQVIPTPTAGVRLVATNAAQALTVSGIVVDAESGEPVQSVQVGAGKAGAMTDRDGRFTLRLEEPGVVELTAVYVGRATERGSVQLRPDQGVIAYIGMKTEPVGFCDAFVTSRRAQDDPPRSQGPIQMEMREVVSGRAPTVQVVVRVSTGSFVEWAFADPTPTDTTSLRMNVGSTLPGDGPFDVEVTSRNHTVWRAGGVWVRKVGDDCSSRHSDLLHVWLLPR